MGKAVRRRLASYWRMEILNVLLVPAMAIGFGFPRTVAQAATLALSVTPMALLLLIGGLYWRGVLLRADGHPKPLAKLLANAGRAENPIAVLIVAAALAATSLTISQGWSAAAIAALLCTALAALEFVNYYRIQLQNFDNIADFRRLLRGSGLRRAHMARDLAAFRQSKR